MYCLEITYGLDLSKVSTCAARANLDYSRINACLTGPLLSELQVLFAQETAALGVAKAGVPWVVVRYIPSSLDNQNTGFWFGSQFECILSGQWPGSGRCQHAGRFRVRGLSGRQAICLPLILNVISELIEFCYFTREHSIHFIIVSNQYIFQLVSVERTGIDLGF
jgi:hypothetical protein